MANTAEGRWCGDEPLSNDDIEGCNERNWWYRCSGEKFAIDESLTNIVVVAIVESDCSVLMTGVADLKANCDERYYSILMTGNWRGDLVWRRYYYVLYGIITMLWLAISMIFVKTFLLTTLKLLQWYHVRSIDQKTTAIVLKACELSFFDWRPQCDGWPEGPLRQSGEGEIDSSDLRRMAVGPIIDQYYSLFGSGADQWRRLFDRKPILVMLRRESLRADWHLLMKWLYSVRSLWNFYDMATMCIILQRNWKENI